MSKKKRRKTRRSGRTQSERKEPAIMDRRAIERTMLDLRRAVEDRTFDSIEEAEVFMKEMVASGGPPARKQKNPLDEAQDLIYDAFEAAGERRIALAREALAVSEDCADAYVLLAEESTDSLEEARDLYQQGVEAGQRALSPEIFEEEAGHFWGLIETRPYMRARCGLAQCLWMLGERRQAIDHLEDMLRLNPNDNQGLRWILANYLLAAGENGAVANLLDQYGDDASATWSYSRALLTFRQEGATEKANACIDAALHDNPFVIRYLTGIDDLPDELPAYMEVGQDSEAVAYAVDAIEPWAKTPGAAEWLATALIRSARRDG